MILVPTFQRVPPSRAGVFSPPDHTTENRPEVDEDHDPGQEWVVVVSLEQGKIGIYRACLLCTENAP